VQKTRLSDLQDRGTTSPEPENVVNLVKVVTFSDPKSSDDVNKNFQKQNEILSREFSTPKRNHFNHFNHITDLDGLNEALTHLENGAEDSPLYLDIETTGLDPRKSSVRLLTLSSGGGQVFVIDLDRVYFPDRLRALLESRTIVGQNLLFDSGFLKHHFKVNITKTWDTMIAGRLLSAGVMEETEGKDKDGNPSTILRPLGNDLSSLLKRYCHIELGEDLSKSDWSQPELTDAQLTYAAEDVAFLPQIKEALEEAIEKDGMTGALELDNDCHPAMRDLNLTGMHVDRAKLEGMYHIAKRTLEDAREEVIQLLGNGDPKWNPDSNSDLREGLARKGISVSATNKEALSPFDGSKEVLALRRYRRAKSADVEKMKSLLDAIDDDSRIRTTYNPVGAITGRISASDPNIQQTPQTDKSNIRYAFTAPPGKKLIKCDWNAMELRAAASYVNEESLLALFAAGRDAHRHTAASIYNKQEDEVTKPERSIAKTANFNLVCGGSAKNLLSIINEDGEIINLEEAEHTRRTFFRLYPVFKAWHSQTWDEAKVGDLQEVRTALGHRRKFHPSLETWKIVFAALNFPIQSASAEVLKFVVQNLHKQLPAGAQIVALLHDEIVLEADETDAQAVMDLTLKTMEEVGSVVFSKVHMKAEGSIRDSWG
jgi:DNA polymerase I-like protein with 3'-5' exonuclease and polymerase domains